jgi:hypothetical protein
MPHYYVGRLTIDIGTSDTLELPVSEKSISYFSLGVARTAAFERFQTSYGAIDTLVGHVTIFQEMHGGYVA